MLAHTSSPSARGGAHSVATRLLLARHGETEWNRLSRWQGCQNIPLTARGRDQAKALAAALKAEPLSAVYSSALQRSVLTAQEIAACHKLNVSRDERLNEMNLGAWEGLTHKEAAERFPQLITIWETDPRSVQPPGGESIAQFEQRVLAMIEEIVLAYPDETVCLIGHKMTNGVIRCRYLGLSLAEALSTVAEQGAYEILDLPHPQWG
jgi:broad specificity phosphatase PhoE